MADDPVQIVKTSRDQGELVSAAVALARSRDARDHETLRHALYSDDFLERLDTEDDYDQSRELLSVAAVLRELSLNDLPEARDTLTKLMRSPVFLQAPSRAELLIEAAAEIRPATPEVIEFWKKYSEPKRRYANVVAESAVVNGSKSAVEHFADMISDPAHDDITRVDWMRFLIVPHRNNAALLEQCEQLLMNRLPENLRGDLVEALFDFKGSWYTPSHRINPPRLASFTTTGRMLLKRIGEYALKNVQLTPEQRKAVEDTLERLERRPSSTGG